jgi:hypothetical protein
MAGLRHVSRAGREDLDRFFGVATTEKVTYPEYSPWREVEFRPIRPEAVGGESFLERPPPPIVEIKLPPLSEPGSLGQKRPSLSSRMTPPKLRRPVILMFGRPSK